MLEPHIHRICQVNDYISVYPIQINHKFVYTHTGNSKIINKSHLNAENIF